MTNKLKPCPCCGVELKKHGRPEETREGWDKEFYVHEGDECIFAQLVVYPHSYASWNNRPTEQALVDALKMWQSRIYGPTDNTMQDVLIATDHALEMAGAVE